MTTRWIVSAMQGEDEYASGVHDDVRDAKAQVFDLISAAGNATAEYRKTAAYEQWIVRPRTGGEFSVLITGMSL